MEHDLKLDILNWHFFICPLDVNLALIFKDDILLVTKIMQRQFPIFWCGCHVYSWLPYPNIYSNSNLYLGPSDILSHLKASFKEIIQLCQQNYFWTFFDCALCKLRLIFRTFQILQLLHLHYSRGYFRTMVHLSSQSLFLLRSVYFWVQIKLKISLENLSNSKKNW